MKQDYSQENEEDDLQWLAYEQQLQERQQMESKAIKKVGKKGGLSEKNNAAFDEIEKILVKGDLSSLNAEQRLIYYKKVCDSAGLNIYTRPFEYLTLNGKTILYARKEATNQLRKIHGISVTRLESETVNNVYIVKAYMKDKTGRETVAIGAVSLLNLVGDNLANALMKAETKAKRRGTLDLCGLGLLDESEIETIPHAKTVPLAQERVNTIEEIDPNRIEGIILDWLAAFSDAQSEDALRNAFEEAKKDPLYRTSQLFREKIAAAKDSQKYFLSMREVKTA